MSSASIPLGPFDLLRPLGRGGMAEVWEGLHRVHGTPVAIKVLTGKGARTPSFRAAFRNEARAAAGLDHPNILRVYDHGEIPPEVERLTEGSLRAGDPFLVMELATGGSLARLCGQLDWPTVRRILLGILEALAHAHARGVIHRDLKPDNVLLVQGAVKGTWMDEDSLFGTSLSGGAQPRGAEIKLSDFGLSAAMELWDPASDGEGSAAGTPAYMAPEQVEGRWRDHGPWTDLYGLGCLAWALVSGAAPFAGLPVMEQIEAHRRREVPDLKASASCALPRGFDDWVHRLLAKDPADRFRWAADAAWALSNLAGADEEAQSAFPFLVNLPTVDPRAGATVHLSEVSLARVTWAEIEGDPDELGQDLGGEPPRSALWSANRSSAPPFPESWRGAGTRARPALVGAGLGLLQMRAPPLVGREAERDLLWSALSEVHATGRARVVLLEGPTGIGKSRLARWLSEHAHEVGAAQTFHAAFSPEHGGGLEVLVERALRLRGLSRPEAQLRIDALLRAQGEQSPEEAAALTELVMPATLADRAAGARVVHFGSPAERVALVHRFLVRFSAERPGIVWLDDAQNSRDALLLARRALEEPVDGAPILLLLTVQQDAPTSREDAAALLGELERTASVQRLRLSPLDPEQHAALIREILSLEDELLSAVVERTAGNPLFALQLLRAWADRGWLAAGRAGIRLRSGARPELPDSLYKLGETRLAALLEGRPAEEGVALELAATLGHEVDGAEWADAVAHARARVPADLIHQLLREGLAEPLEGDNLGGFRFVQGVLRESLLRRAAEGGRLADHHRVCAEVLAARTDPGGALAERGARAMRLGRHLRAAGRPREALEPLLNGVRGRLVGSDMGHARALLREWEAAAGEARLAPTDERWGEGWYLFGEVSIREGRAEEGRSWFQHAAEAARAYGWRELLARSLVGVAWASLDLGEYDVSERSLDEADRALAGLVRPKIEAELLRFRARLLLWRGEHDEALRVASRALALYEGEEDHLGAGHAHALMADCANFSGALEVSMAHAARAISEYEKVGYRWGMAFCSNTLGESARAQGRLDEALAHYRAALALYRAIGAGQAVVPYVNVGLTLLAAGQAARAKPILEFGLKVAEERAHRILAASLKLALLTPLAEEDDWDAFDAALDSATVVIEQTGSVDVDNARTTELAGRTAARMGHLERATRALQLALRQWTGLHREDEAAQVREALRALEEHEA